MKFKSRVPGGVWRSKLHIRRRLSWPQFNSSLPGEVAADAVHLRCQVFRLAKRINKLAKKRMAAETLQQIMGGN